MHKFVEKIKMFAFDLDGTLYVKDRAISGAVELINILRAKYQIVFFTNNSSKSRKEVYEKLNNLGFKCELNEVYTSSYATALYLKESYLDNIYVIGSEGFCDDLKNIGLRIVDSEIAENLVVGLDSRFNYTNIASAMSVLLKGGKFIVCNEDSSFPIGEGKFLPGCGAIVSAIATSTDRKPDFVVGKPNTYMLAKIAKIFNVENYEIIVVGDSYESDIKMAINYNSKAIFIGANKNMINDNIIITNDINKIKDFLNN